MSERTCQATVVNFARLLSRDLRSDVSLLRGYADGDASAFEALYTRHKDGLFNFIFRSVSRQAIAEEIAQDVWLSIIKDSPGYEPGTATFRTWLYSVARNKIVDFFRRAANQYHAGAVPDAPRAETLDESGVALPHSADSEVEQNLLVSQLLEALERLPAEQREAFILQQEGFTAKEIADITGVSREAVKSRLRYAKSTTRARLEAS